MCAGVAISTQEHMRGSKRRRGLIFLGGVCESVCVCVCVCRLKVKGELGMSWITIHIRKIF